MLLFLASGRDSSSDYGSFHIIIRAESNAEARKIAKQHLLDNNRENLTVTSIVKLKGEVIVYTDLDCYP